MKSAYYGLVFTAAINVSFLFGGLTRRAPCEVFSIVVGSCCTKLSTADLAAAFAVATITDASCLEAEKGGAIIGVPTYGGGFTDEDDVPAVTSGRSPGGQECP